jgi:hypothetical protein
LQDRGTSLDGNKLFYAFLKNPLAGFFKAQEINTIKYDKVIDFLNAA